LHVPAAKGQDDLLISHLCGTRNCVNPNHLVLEPKGVNDERTSCHFALRNVTATAVARGTDAASARSAVLGLGLCPHSPTCGSDDVPEVTTLCNTCTWQKVRDEPSLYNRKLQETPGKSVTTAAGGPTTSAAGVPSAPDRKNVTVGGVKRPDPCIPLGQSAAKLPTRLPGPAVHCDIPIPVVDTSEEEGPGAVRGGRSTTTIDWSVESEDDDFVL
jgi:hypothetical protein